MIFLPLNMKANDNFIIYDTNRNYISFGNMTDSNSLNIYDTGRNYISFGIKQ